ncbi:exotoxin, partial [Staphylococcus lutrae]
MNGKFKKFLVIALLLLFSGVFQSVLTGSNVIKAESQPDPTPTQLNKSSQFTGLMQNMQYLYDSHYVQGTNVRSYDQLFSSDLIYSIQDTVLGNYDRVKVEFKNKTLADKYKNKNVDVFGSNYYRDCYFSENSKKDSNRPNRGSGKTCMYGGITEREGNLTDSPINIPVKVYEDNWYNLYFNIDTNKKRVTAQELDIKVRDFLIKYENLYGFNSSPYETGYIKFIGNNKNSFWYDMMPPPGDDLDQSRYLMIYNDNKTVDASKVTIEVHL